jgi:hypothetical protein
MLHRNRKPADRRLTSIIASRCMGREDFAGKHVFLRSPLIAASLN